MFITFTSKLSYRVFCVFYLPLSFWQNSAKMMELKIRTKLKQSFQTTNNQKFIQQNKMKIIRKSEIQSVLLENP